MSRAPGPGDRVGPYRVLRRLGAGGMGVVYEATHSVLEKRVALKTWLVDESDPDLASRFVDEGRAASRLRHPNVVDVTDIGVHDGVPYLVMELLEGEPLDAAIARAGAMPARSAIDLILPVVDALSAAHAVGIVHRDLKPQNIFLALDRRDVVPKLLDFGISKMSGGAARTATDSFLGTPAYMSPEQLRDARSVDARSDLYSLCLVLFELLAGQRAVRGQNVVEAIHAITSGDLVPLAELRPDLPEALIACVNKGLSFDRDDRFTSARGLGDALAPFASEEGRRLWSRTGAVEALDASSTPAVDALEVTARPASTERARELFRTSVVACLPLAVEGVEEPTGWLGATASHALGRRLRWVFGGQGGRVLVPAELAGLPADTGRAYPPSPYDAVATADAARRAGRSSGSLLTGVIRRGRDRLTVEARLESGGVLLASARADGPNLADVARDVVLGLGDLVGWGPLHDEAREAYGEVDPRSAVALEDVLGSLAEAPPSARARVVTLALGPVANAVRMRATRGSEVDNSSAAARAWSAYAAASAGAPLTHEIREQLRADIEAARGPHAQATFRALASLRAAQEGDGEAAWALALRASSIDPTCALAWDALIRATPRARNTSDHAWRVMTWAPDTQLCLPPDAVSEVTWGRTLLRRAHTTSPEDVMIAFHRAAFDVRAGDVSGVELLAARWDELPPLRPAALGARALVDLRQASFASALDRFTKALFDPSSTRFGDGIDWSLVQLALQTGEVLGRARSIADRLVDHLSGTSAPVIVAQSQAADMMLLDVASYASPDKARAGVALARSLVERSAIEWPSPDLFRPISRALDLWLDGRESEMARLIRPLARTAVYRNLVARLLDVAGESELADRVDGSLLAAERSLWAGAEMAHVRVARRAAQRGEQDAARAVAAQVIEAWSVADDDVPWLAELRAL